MQAGKLRQRLMVQTPVVNLDGDGGQHVDWLDVVTIWGWVEPLKMTETLIAEQIAARASHRIILRWRLGLAPTVRLVLQPSGRVFDVVSVLNRDERNRELVVMALEKVGG